uniref:phospholipase A n=1 Tax=Candidatus Limisoma sp. TaxID=3076476 RepID=UPI004027DD2E
LRRELDNGPYFTLYKDNYFITGTSIGPQAPSRTNSDVKFQVSIAQRLTKSTLPFNTYLFLFYSQKCMWNIYEESLPMRDLNFNPGIGLAKHLFVKNRYIGKVTLLVEHESNGRDGVDSRSWNKISLACNIFIDPNFMIHGKAWIPIIDGMNNKDILDYSGIYQTGMTYTTPNKRFGFGLTLIKRRGWRLSYNTIWEFNYRVFKKDNQFLFVQYYNGYGENLLDYNKFHSRLRVGLVIKPKLFSDF